MKFWFSYFMHLKFSSLSSFCFRLNVRFEVARSAAVCKDKIPHLSCSSSCQSQTQRVFDQQPKKEASYIEIQRKNITMKSSMFAPRYNEDLSPSSAGDSVVVDRRIFCAGIGSGASSIPSTDPSRDCFRNELRIS